MKALSLKQPYAELILEGKKKIELRNWKTNFRGEFFIHASKNPDEESMKRFGFTTLPLGALVGKANLVDVKIYNNEEEHSRDSNLHLASSDWGSNGFVLENPTRISPIIPFKGQLNFFETNLN
jgi:predicted transcriptional regulator